MVVAKFSANLYLGSWRRLATIILVAPQAARLEHNSPALQAAVTDALGLAEMILLRIDNRWHTMPDQKMTTKFEPAKNSPQ